MEHIDSKIQALIARPESPRFEREVRLAAEESLKDLVSSRFLYQNKKLEFDGMKGGPVSHKLHRNMHSLFNSEALIRPLEVLTERSFESSFSMLHNPARSRYIEPHEIVKAPIRFFARSCNLECSICDQSTTFRPVVANEISSGTAPNLSTGAPKEQNFSILYACAHCDKSSHIILLNRKGVNFQLCGFAPQRQPTQVKNLPRDLRKIYCDAIQAAEQADVFAAFYHLRTLIEFYMKNKISKPVQDRITGEDLVAAYNNTLLKKLREILPSMSTLYQELSTHMHSRSGGIQEFEDLSNRIVVHITSARDLLRFSIQDQVE